LGGTIEVPTLGGNVELKVPNETQSGRVFRLREKGVKPVRGGATGDLFCRVVIETPVNLTDEQKDLLREFEKSVQGSVRNHSPRESTWLDGVKRFFDTIRS
jgi:molecular chaperone DnaJ